MAGQSVKAGANKNYLQEILSKYELSHVSKSSTEKINKFISSKFGDVPTSSKEIQVSTNYHIQDTSTELQKQVEELNIELQKSRDNIVFLENEMISIKDVRDHAIDDKNNLAGLLVRNTAEIERYKLEISELSSKLQEAVDIKCEALEQNNEIQSKEFVLQQREKRMEEDKLLLNTQIASLTEEIEKLTSELQTASFNNNAKIIHLESKLAEVNNELNTANEIICRMGNDNKVLNTQVEFLTKSILKEKDLENVVTNYDKELSEKEKVSNMYKTMHEEAAAKINEMAERIVTLEKLLQESVNKYNELELKSKHMEKEKDELVEQKNKEILNLKCDLENSKQQLTEADSQSIDMALNKLTPNAAEINKLLNFDMSLTELYSELVNMSDALAKEKAQNIQLEKKYNKSTQELEKHVLYLQKAKAEQKEILEKNIIFVAKVEELTVEKNRLSNEITELSTLCEKHDIEKIKLKNELADLGRQICFLLRKNSIIEGNDENNLSDVSMNESTNEENHPVQLISKTLVTFSDIQELQNNNQLLLSKVRELTEKKEKEQPSEEQFDKESYLNKINELENRILELSDSQNVQTKMVSGLIRQRNTYKKLYNDHIQGKRLELPSIPITNMECQEVPEPKTTNLLDESCTKATDLEMNYKKTREQLDALDKEYRAYKNEQKNNEKILSAQVESMRKETSKLSGMNSKYCATAEFNNERIKQLEASIIYYKKQIDLVEEKNEIYNNSNAKYEVALKQLRDEVIEAHRKLATAEVQLEKYKLECKLKTEHEISLKNENKMLSSERRGQDILLTNLELIKVCLERKETEKCMKLESKLKYSIQECDTIKKKCKADEDQLKELEENFKRLTETTNTRLQEERKAASSMRNEILELRQNLANRNKTIEELTKKLKIALRPNESNNSEKNRGLEERILDRENEIKTLNEELKIYKSNSLVINQKWDNINKLIKTINDKQCNFKSDCEKKIREYCKRIQLVQRNSNRLRSKNFTSNVMRNDIFSSSKLSGVPEKIREELNLAHIQLQKMTDLVHNAEQKYANEMLLHSEDIQKLTELKDELLMKEKQLKEITALKDGAMKKMEMDNITWNESVETLKKENELLSERFEELTTQNYFLLDQIQSLSSQITHTTSQLSDSCNESNVSNMNISVGEDEAISSEKMLSIIKFLRKEKDMAVAKSNTLHAESARLKSQMVILEKQLDNAKTALNHQKEMTSVSQPINLQSEILKKVETLNALTDSNRLLRSERDNLLNKVEALTQSVNSFENNLPLLNQKISELTVKCTTLETENTTLKADITCWRNKVSVLAERANKSSPEDWKRLQIEREALAKMLTAEKEKVKKLGGQLANLKTDLEDNSALSQENISLKEEQKKLHEQLETLNKEVSKLTEQTSKLNSELTNLLEKNQALTNQINANESVMTDLKNKELQIKKIAKKYKMQYEELLQKIENQTVVADNLIEETAKKSEEQLTELQHSLQTEKSNAEKLKSDLDSEKLNAEKLKSELDSEKSNAEKFKSDLDSSIDREDKAKQLLKIAKNKIVQLTEDKKNLTTQIEKIGENDVSVVSEDANVKDVALAQKTKEIERLKMQIDSLESQLSNYIKADAPRPQEIVKAPKGDASISNNPGAAETTLREAESPSSQGSTHSMPQPGTRSPEYMPSSSSRSSLSQDVEYLESGPVTADIVQQHKLTLPEVSLIIPHLDERTIASATKRAPHSTEGSNGSVSSATTEARPLKRPRSFEPNTTQKKPRQDVSQTDDPECEAPSSSRCDDEDDTSTRSSTVDDEDEDEPLSTHATSQPSSEPAQIEASSSGTDTIASVPVGSDGDERVQPSTPKHYATRSTEGSSEAMGSPSVPESSPRHRSRGRGRGKTRSFQRGPNPPPVN